MCSRHAERVRAWPVVVVVKAVPGADEEGDVVSTSMWVRQGDSSVRTKSMPRASGSSALRLTVGAGTGLLGEVRCDDAVPDKGGEMGCEKFMAPEDGLGLGGACGCVCGCCWT